MEDKHVVIVGAGFAGLELVKKLANRKGIKITLIDKTNYHLFQPLLYQVASSVLSPADIAIPIRSLTTSMKNVQVILGTVLEIHKEHRKINLEHTTINYDYLILAMGAKTSYFGNNGWEKYSIGLKNINDALKIRNKILLSFERAELESNPEKAKSWMRYAIIGGGPTGVEVAGSIAELSHNIIRKDFRFIDPALSEIFLIEAGPRLLPSFSEKSSEITKKRLEERGVKVLVNSKVINIDDEGVELQDQKIISKIKVWAAGVSGNSFGDKLNTELDRSGRVIVNKFCSLDSNPEIFVIGDMASFLDTSSNKTLPGVSPVAMQQGRYVADIILSEIKGNTRTKGFEYFDKGSMATIGRKDAVAEMGKLRLSGFLGWLGWLFIHLFYLVGFKNKFSILITWIWSYITFKAGARLIQDTSEE